MTEHAERRGGVFIGIVMLAVVAIYAFACCIPCIDNGPQSFTGDPSFPDLFKGVHYGWALLLIGWCGFVPWYANVFLLVALVLFCQRRFRAAIRWGTFAFLLGLTTRLFVHWHSPLIGYYMWQSSFLVVVCGSSWGSYRYRERAAKLTASANEQTSID